MPIELLIVAALPWILMLSYAFHRHRFAILLIWLLVAPTVTYLVEHSGKSIVAKTEGTEMKPWESNFYYEQPAEITLQKLFEPNRMLFGALALIFLLDGLVKKQRSISMDVTEIWMAIFSVILLANVLLWSARLAFGLRIAIDAFIVPFFGYYFARRLVTNEDRFNRLMRVLGYMAFYVIVFCLIERLTTSDLFYRVSGPFESANTLHTVLTVSFFIALINPLHEGRPALPPLIRRTVIYLVPVIMAFTLTRGNWVGFLSGVGVFLMFGRRLVSFPLAVGKTGLALIFMVIVGLFLPLLVPEQLVEGRIADSVNVFGRFATWIATIELAAQAPVLGVGLNNLHGLLSRQTVSVGEFTNYSTPHNSFLSISVELGVLGLVAYLAILAVMIKIGLNLYQKGLHSQDRWRGVAIVAIMISYLTASLFSNTIYIPGLIHVYIYVFAGAIAGLYGPLPSTSSEYAFSIVARKRAAYQLPYAIPTWNRRRVEGQYER